MPTSFDACNLNATPMDFIGKTPVESTNTVNSKNPVEPTNTVESEISVESGDTTNRQSDALQAVVSAQPLNSSKEQNKILVPNQPHEPGERTFQRLADARRQQGFSLRTIARRTGLDIRTLRSHESPNCDLRLSELHAWQKALEVPLVDLIEDESQPLSRPVKERAKLLRIMKTAVSIKEAGGSPRVQRLADMLCEQLVELMPELNDIGGWPQHGSRRSDNSCRIVEQQVNVRSLELE